MKLVNALANAFFLAWPTALPAAIFSAQTTTGIVAPCGPPPYAEGASDGGSQRRVARSVLAASGQCNSVLGQYPEDTQARAFAATSGIMRIYTQASGDSAASADASADVSLNVTLIGPPNATSVTDTEELEVSGTVQGMHSSMFAAMTICPVFEPCMRSEDGVHKPTDPQDFTLSITFDAVAVKGIAHIELIYTLAGSTTPDCLPPCTGLVDYSDTAKAIQILPPGWTFTSDSGDFLTPAQETPEPSTLLMFGTALIVLSRARRSGWISV